MVRKFLLGTVCSVALLSTTGAAFADDDGHWYVGLDGSYSIEGTENYTGSSLDLDSKFKDGFAIDGRIGYDFGKFRLEAEISHHSHNGNNFTVRDAGGLGLTDGSQANGKSKLFSYMLNGVYDFGDPAENAIEPFVGLGFGLADLDFKNLGAGANNLANFSDNVFAYQAFAGLRFGITDALSFSVKYRYLATADADMIDANANPFKATYDVHDFMLGFSYKFGVSEKVAPAPAPIPEPAPAPEPVPVVEVVPEPTPEPAPAPEPVIDMGPYIVYFAWDSSIVDETSLGIITKAAAAASMNDDIVINLGAHTDSSGAAVYNNRLALKRGANVKNALVARGISAARISVVNNVEGNQETSTADNVKESSNRRVTIMLSK